METQHFIFAPSMKGNRGNFEYLRLTGSGGRIRERRFKLSDSKPNIYDSLKRYLREHHNINLSSLTNASRMGGIFLCMSKDEFNNDHRITIVDEW